VGTGETAIVATIIHEKPKSGGTFKGNMPENIYPVDELTLGNRR
jgi:hypothetical protein